ncbi:MAG: 30S ribosomal protein S17, partial [Spirochaetes bacterium]|nr:30S ribosomal protein S17 [Spirochaetota bacterium]
MKEDKKENSKSIVTKETAKEPKVKKETVTKNKKTGGVQQKSILERKRKYTGMVFSKNGEKTIKVEIEKWTIHPLYKKRIKKSRKMLVHDRNNQANIGDKVLIVESRPISKLKRW